MNYYIFQVSRQSAYAKQKEAIDVFNDLVRDRSAWGFGFHTPNRKVIAAEDKVLFYLTGANNQVFVGAATLTSGAYKDESGESKDWFLDPETLRIDLKDVVVFSSQKPRKSFKGLEWQPAQGGSSKISERDYNIIMGIVDDAIPQSEIIEEEQEFVLEKYLEEFIFENWDRIKVFEKLKPFEDENGNTGRQYFTGEVGYIDILALDKDNNFVVVELKKGRKNDEVVGQVMRYIGWVRSNLAEENQHVRGLIIVGKKDSSLDYALAEVKDKVDAMVYKMSFKLDDY